MDLFGWQLDTWWEWAVIITALILTEGVCFWIFGTLIITRLFIEALLSAATKGKYKGGGGKSGGGGSNGSW